MFLPSFTTALRGEFRAKNGAGPTHCRFLAPNDHEALKRFLVTYDTYDHYWGIATRKDDSGGTADNTRHLSALFADLDFDKVDEVQARGGLAGFALSPSIVVHSGGGLHVYWLFREPLDLEDRAERALAEALLRRLKVAVGGDDVCDLARILRVPATYNHKPKYVTPRKVVVEYFDPEARYNPGEFDAVLPADPAPPAKTGPYQVPPDAQPGERNNTLVRLGRKLKAGKLPPPAILANLEGYNSRLSEPLPADEVSRIFDSVLKRRDRHTFEPTPEAEPLPGPPAQEAPPSSDADAPAAALPALLDDLVAYIRRFVVLSEAQAQALALWVCHTYVMDAADLTPYLHITAGTRRAGKSLLLAPVLQAVVHRPWSTTRTTVAALARKIDAAHPTLLLDESDQAFDGKSDYCIQLIGVLNAGFSRHGTYSACVGEGAGLGTKDFDVFSAKAIAGIGKLPTTIADRSIPIVLRRKLKSDMVDRARDKVVRGAGKPLRERCAQWARTALPSLKGAEPVLPAALNDRQQDIWEPLLAIADAAGEAWAAAARRAAVALSGEQEDDDDRVQLLGHIHELLTPETPQPGLLPDQAPPVADVPTVDGVVETVALHKALTEREDWPWATRARGKPISAERLTTMLKRFGLRPGQYWSSTRQRKLRGVPKRGAGGADLPLPGGRPGRPEKAAITAGKYTGFSTR